MGKRVRAAGTVALVVLIAGCGQARPVAEEKLSPEQEEGLKRIERSQIRLAESSNEMDIEKLEKSTARMRSAKDAKEAVVVAAVMIDGEEYASTREPIPWPFDPEHRDRAGNAQRLRDAERAHAEAKREFLQRHPGVLEEARTVLTQLKRLKKLPAAEAAKELKEAVGGSTAGKK